MNDRDILDNNLTLRWTLKDTKNLYSNLTLKFIQVKLKLLSWISHDLAASYAWKVFTTPQRVKNHTKKEPFNFDEMSQNSFLGHKIYEYIHNLQGDESVLVVHGWGSQASDFNSLILSLLDHRFKVVSFDSPAHGLSTGNQTNAVEVSKIIAYLDKKHGGFDAIIGHSFGGISSSLALASNSDIKAKLITIGSPNKLSAILHEFQSLLQMNLETQIKLHKHIEKLYGKKIDDFNVETFIQKSSRKSLVIHDEYDKQLPISKAIEITNNNPKAELFKTYGLGHNRILNDQVVKQKIIDFIS